MAGEHHEHQLAPTVACLLAKPSWLSQPILSTTQGPASWASAEKICWLAVNIPTGKHHLRQLPLCLSSQSLNHPSGEHLQRRLAPCSPLPSSSTPAPQHHAHQLAILHEPSIFASSSEQGHQRQLLLRPPTPCNIPKTSIKTLTTLVKSVPYCMSSKTPVKLYKLVSPECSLCWISVLDEIGP